MTLRFPRYKRLRTQAYEAGGQGRYYALKCLEDPQIWAEFVDVRVTFSLKGLEVRGKNVHNKSKTSNTPMT